MLVRCGSGYSFTSSHATNHFAIATFLSFSLGTFLRKVRTPLFTWAGVISLAQVYVGVHFPLDVLCGGLLGFSVGLFWAWVFMRYYGHILHNRHHFPTTAAGL
ncbi:MAG: phosphatase PAP2 family protein [Saprospiraceae bacterium]|nr:phosphatase PAP2 family protein [Saprospiraceae bacterium]